MAVTYRVPKDITLIHIFFYQYQIPTAFCGSLGPINW